VFPPPPGYLQGLRELCEECGALLVFDEVITGFGRLGSWFGSHHYGVTPDVTTFAKAVTSGYLPLGGVVVGPRLREWLEADPSYLLAHGNTYGGHPTCCAAGVANIELMRAEDLPARAAAAGARLRAGLEGLLGNEGVAEVRGEGLVQAVALGEGLTAGAFTEALLARGVIGRGLPYANSVAFSPPLIVSDEEVDELVAATAAVLDELGAG
jgi:adenosylmethionine-8-amino-7-oxononanoate aminotransferase